MKMETPKMDVVRFNEADVIVASGDHRRMATLAGWANGNPADATLSFTNGSNVTYTWNQIQDMTEHDLGGLNFTNASGNSATIEQLASDEESYGDWNGTYVRSSKGQYDWYNGQ